MYIKSIRTRLTIWYTCLLTVTLLIVGGAAFVLLSYSLSHEMDNALDSVARALMERDQSRAATFPPSEIDLAFRRFFGFSPWDHYFQMRDPSGNRDEHRSLPSTAKLPLSSTALNNAMRGLSTFETVEGLGEYPVRLLTMPVMESNRVINMIQVGMSLKSIDETYVRFLLIMAGTLPLGLLLAASGGWLLAHRALKPVDRMTAAARRISAEHLSQRVEETGTGDELDNLAKTLNQMLTRLDDAFSQIRRFSADASHELQTPLTILKGELEVVLRSKRTAEEYRATLESALEEVDRTANLVEGLLLLARAEAGVLRMDRQEVDLGQMLEEVYIRLKPLADSRSIELQLGAIEPLSIQGDRERLERMTSNLVDNAIKYTGAEGRVTLGLEHDSRCASILVSDTGKGISVEDQKHIFQAFYRTSEARSLAERGTGLGLSIAQSIAAAHGGTIKVESAPGRGSSFKVLIPITS
ncbi:Integral membrane sensor signal transduction histidine kinase [Syntrophobacter sp. SbD2]|nr:Integral membrane sensor signal transduction histidine kinase [Syntrophobacter sp. SbD2]